MANLTGNLTDVTNQAPSTVVSITVKAPSVRLGTGNGLIVSSPAEVAFNHDTGALTLTGITGGLSWLVIEGNGWSDTVALSVAGGMTTLVEAVANAIGTPGMVDYVKLMAALSGAVDGVAQDAVDAAAESIMFDQGPAPIDVTDINDLAIGSHGIPSTTIANNLGLPFTQGTLLVSRIATGKTVIGIANKAGFQEHEIWVTSVSGGTTAPWTKVYPSADSDPGLKTVGVALTAGSTLGGDAGRYRVLAQVTAPVTRWRVHFECRRMIYETTRDFTLGTVQVGDHTGNGTIANVETLKSGNSTISGNREWVSKWIDRDLDEEVLIDFQASGSSLMTFNAPAFKLNGSTWDTSKSVPLAVWIEVETYQQTPVVAMIGDSTGAGQGADRPVHDSALHIAARKHKFIPMNYSYPGSGLNTMANGDMHIYKRWENLAKPDSVVIQAGSNNIHGGVSLSEIQGYLEDVVNMARDNISPVVLGSTVKARYPDSGEHQTTLNEYNAWVKTQPDGTRGYLDFYQAISPNGTVEAADAADAAHLSTSGHAKGASAFDSVDVSRPPAVLASEIGQLVPGQVFSGAGSPEGAISAPVGASYVDTAATNGAIRWIKTSGTGSTGWRVEYGDTGWRDITSLIVSSPAIVMGTGAKISIRRTGGSVFFRVIGPVTMGGQFGNIVAAHPGLRPDVDTNSQATRGAILRNTRYWVRLEDGTRDAVLTESGRAIETMWSTTEAWPETLPGTPF